MFMLSFFKFGLKGKVMKRVCFLAGFGNPFSSYLFRFSPIKNLGIDDKRELITMWVKSDKIVAI